MKLRLLICTVLLALFVVPAFADSVTITNVGGQLSGSSSGINATKSIINTLSVDGLPPISGNIGVLGFDTGALTGGSFSGGDFKFGQDPSDVIMFTNFAGTLTKIGKDLYDLVGAFSGTIDGVKYIGTTTQTFSFSGDDHGRDDGNGCWSDLHGTTTITTAAVPEPSTLTFLGTGLIALAGAVRRKLGARA